MENKKEDKVEKNQGSHEQEEKEGRKKISLKSKIAFAFSLLFLCLIIAVLALYFHPPFAKLAQPIFKRIPFPVAVIDNGRFVITSSELTQSTQAVKKFYESQDYAKLNLRVDFSTDDGEKRLKIKEKDVLDKLIENKIIERLANERGILISSKEAREEVERVISEGGDKESLKLNLMSMYGWNLADFSEKVVKHQMYTKELLEWYVLSVETGEEIAKMEQAQSELNQDGSNFEEIAKKYSEGESAENNGELGWFSKDELVYEVEEVVSAMGDGEISDLVISPLGFHIVQVVEKGQEGTENAGKVRLRQIFVRGVSFLDWLSGQKKNANVRVLMKDYVWSKEKGGVVFRDNAMNKTEERLKLKADGDPSL